LGFFLFKYLTGSQFDYPCVISVFPRGKSSVLTNFSGFQSTYRGNTLVQKILAADIAQGLNKSTSIYTADNCEPYM